MKGILKKSDKKTIRISPMKKATFLMLILLPALTVKAQQQLSYAYDAAGNRVSRTIVMGTRGASSVNQPDSVFLEEVLAEKQVKIYPNPVQYELTISITGYEPSMRGEYSLFSLGGSMLARRKITGETTRVDMSLFSKGTYILNIQLEGRPTSWKIIKQ